MFDSVRVTSRCLFVLLTTAFLGVGCVKTDDRLVRIPNGPRIILPQPFHSVIEGDHVRFGVDDLTTERCAGEIRVTDERAPPKTTVEGNTEYVVLARTFGAQTILLTFCPVDPSLNEERLRGILLNNLRP